MVSSRILEDVVQQPPRQASSAAERVIPRPVHVENGHSLWYPATVFGVLLHDQVGPIMYRHVVHVEESLQGRDVHVVLHEPDKLVAAAHFGEVEECLVPCLHHASHEVSVGVSAVPRHLHFDREKCYVALDTHLVLILVL